MILLDTNVISGLMDAQIAAIALAAGGSVATRDVGPFSATVPTINPWQA